MIRCLIVVFSITVSLLVLVNMNILEFYGAASASTQDSFQMSEEKTVCITYTNYKDVDESASTGNNLITINCKEPTNLTKVYENIKDPRVLQKEKGSNNTWILDASLIIEKGSTVVIDSADTKWLKILAGDNSEDGDRDNVNHITALGNLIIDSVKITSWDPTINDVIKFEYNILPDREHEHTGIDAVPRPYIKAEDETTGTMNITNSELAYLGYECGSGCSGISYYGSNGTSIIKNNEIHDNRFGFYSVGVGDLILEGNHVHHNFMYGFDPHTATHDMIIRNNTVHDHGAMGIICSLDCYNITIEDNEVYNSAGSGIMFSRNMYDSIARNNNVHDEDKCIFLSQSPNNEVYNNIVTNCESQGIYLYHNSIENKVYNNTLINTTEGIEYSDDSLDNLIQDNMIQ